MTKPEITVWYRGNHCLVREITVWHWCVNGGIGVLTGVALVC